MADKDKSDALLLGTHVSVAGGMAKGLDRAESIGCTAMQVFVKGNTRWEFPPLDADDARAFRERLASSPVRAAIAHTIYLVNLASANPDIFAKSVADMVDELGRCDALGISGLVMHPGAHCGIGVDEGIARIAAGIDEIHAALPRGTCRILLETTAGQGTCIGHEFGHIAQIISSVRQPKRLGVCLDTCHVFAAGHDLRARKGYEAMWREFDAALGAGILGAIHVNDSKKPLGSRVDRHEHIGKGELRLEAFRFLMNDPRLRGVPMVLETDKGPDMAEDIENMRLLRSLVRVRGKRAA
jgi:deoxyribonuclease-4